MQAGSWQCAHSVGTDADLTRLELSPRSHSRTSIHFCPIIGCAALSFDAKPQCSSLQAIKQQ
jgi:hypothetical protein